MSGTGSEVHVPSASCHSQSSAICGPPCRTITPVAPYHVKLAFERAAGQLAGRGDGVRLVQAPFAPSHSHRSSSATLFLSSPPNSSTWPVVPSQANAASNRLDGDWVGSLGVRSVKLVPFHSSVVPMG